LEGTHCLSQRLFLPASSQTAPTMVIWGTDNYVVPFKDKFKKFMEFRVYPDLDTDEVMSGKDKNCPTYMQLIKEIAVWKTRSGT